jgi:hypothetical protein
MSNYAVQTNLHSRLELCHIGFMQLHATIVKRTLREDVLVNCARIGFKP